VSKPTRKQQGLYRAQLKRLEAAGWGDEMRRDLLEAETGKRSTSEISAEEMRRVIDAQNKALRKAGLAPLTTRTKGTFRKGQWNQDEYVAQLELDLGWQEAPERLAGFIRRQTGGLKGCVEDLTTGEKTRLINGLKAEKRSQADGTARAERPLPRRQSEGEERFRFIPGGKPACLL